MEQKNNYEKFYLSYKRALAKINMQGIRKKNGDTVMYKDLVEAINVMNKKHYKCRWKFQKYNSGKKYILIEGYFWLIYVYFQTNKNLLDADIDFFKARIEQYENLLGLPSKTFWTRDIKLKELPKYFNRSSKTINRSLIAMTQSTATNFIIKKDKEKILLKEGVKWLCKNYFKKKYLSLLENYKMELTEKYIKKGYIYDYTNIIGI